MRSTRTASVATRVKFIHQPTPTSTSTNGACHRQGQIEVKKRFWVRLAIVSVVYVRFELWKVAEGWWCTMGRTTSNIEVYKCLETYKRCILRTLLFVKYEWIWAQTPKIRILWGFLKKWNVSHQEDLRFWDCPFSVQFVSTKKEHHVWTALLRTRHPRHHGRRCRLDQTNLTQI